jgi:hypothetical protein
MNCEQPLLHSVRPFMICPVWVFLFVSYTCPLLIVLTGCSISNLQYLISLLMQFLVSDMKWVIARQNHCWLMHHHICSFVALCLPTFAPTWHNSPYFCAGQNELGTFLLWVAPMDPKGTKLIDCWNVSGHSTPRHRCWSSPQVIWCSLAVFFSTYLD